MGPLKTRGHLGPQIIEHGLIDRLDEICVTPSSIEGHDPLALTGHCVTTPRGRWGACHR